MIMIVSDYDEIQYWILRSVDDHQIGRLWIVIRGIYIYIRLD